MNLRERLANATGGGTRANVPAQPSAPVTRELTEEERDEVSGLFDSSLLSGEAENNVPIEGQGSGETAPYDTLNELLDRLIEHMPQTTGELIDAINNFDNSAATTAATSVQTDDIASIPYPEPFSNEPMHSVEPLQQDTPQPRTRRSRRNAITQEATSRFSGAPWYEEIQKQDVTIVGAGGIGSWTALLVSRLGVNCIVLYDDDVIELGNISGQLYTAEDVDMFKVSALSSELARYSLFTNTTAFHERFVSGKPITKVVIACLDSMSARRAVFEDWKRKALAADDKEAWLFIDGRLSAEVFQVYAVSGSSEEDMQRYSRTLFNDSEADSETCSYKQTSFMANMIASFITNIFVNYIASKLEGGAAREIPFKTEYLGEMMWTKLEM